MIHILEHVLLHTLEETLKLLPFLFLTYLAMEYLENRAGNKTIELLSRTGKQGPIVGGILGIVPQCGFSAMAASLYAGGVITVGTMVAVFLSTSDEMLPILISGKAEGKVILAILGGKIFVGVVAGLVIDFLIRKTHRGGQKGLQIHDICEREGCHCCEGSILYSAGIHTVKVTIFVFFILAVIHLVAEWIGLETLIEMAGNNPIASIFLMGIIGMIPNCAVSVAITTLYLEGVLSFGSMFAGLLSCAGVGLVVLFKANKNWKKNVVIMGGIYAISVLCGIVIEIVL